LMASPLLTQWGMTTRTLLNQANDPVVNHPTPWIALSTRINATAVTAGPGRTNHPDPRGRGRRPGTAPAPDNGGTGLARRHRAHFALLLRGGDGSLLPRSAVCPH